MANLTWFHYSAFKTLVILHNLLSSNFQDGSDDVVNVAGEATSERLHAGNDNEGSYQQGKADSPNSYYDGPVPANSGTAGESAWDTEGAAQGSSSRSSSVRTTWIYLLGNTLVAFAITIAMSIGIFGALWGPVCGMTCWNLKLLYKHEFWEIDIFQMMQPSNNRFPYIFCKFLSNFQHLIFLSDSVI